MHNIGIMCEDIKAMVAFFVELGLEVEGETRVEGRWMERIINIDDAQCDIAMLRTPDGHNRLELSQFIRPKATSIGEEKAPVNTLGIRRIMFQVDDLDDVLTRIEKHGASLIGEVVNYENMYRLCYVRGPEGVMLALAEEIGAPKLFS